VTFLLFLLALAGLLYRLTTAEDRARYKQLAVENFHQVKAAANRPRPELDAFDAALRARTGRPFFTIALVAICGAALVMRWDPSTGIRTTNGEWWRLLTSPFAHPTLLQLAVNAAALYQAGNILERLAGRAVLAITFLSATLAAGIATIAAQPVAPASGVTGGVLGIYGGLIAAVVLSRRRTDVPDEFRIVIPRLAMRRVATVAGVVVMTNSVAGAIPLAGELAALAVGLACGAALMGGIGETTPPAQRISATAAAVAILVIVTAWPLKGIADVRPEIARVFDTEDRTTAAYLAELERLKKNKTTADAVARMIDGMIAQALQDTDARLKALKKVPPEHQPLVNDAEEFLRLRAESWRLRSASLRTVQKVPPRQPHSEDDRSAGAAWRVRAEAQFRSTRAAIGKAEAMERSSLEVLARLKASA
jgi:membrane associated rhomboid family serine protease